MSEDNIMHRVIGGDKGGKGGGGSQRIAQEAPNTLQSRAVLRVVECISEGEIVGLVNGAKSVYFDGTPLQNADNTYNFKGVALEQRKGTPDQAHLAGFKDVPTEVAVGVLVTQPLPIVRAINDADTDAVVVTARLSALTEQNKTNGDLNGSSVRYQAHYQPNGGSYILGADITITGKTTSTYERQTRIELTGSAPWNIKFTRITADNVDATINNDVTWASYTRVIDHKLTYPDSALIGLTIDSTLFGSSVPTRSFDVKGRILSVPVNYDPITRVYTGVWNGTFKQAWTDNPAWVMYDLLTHPRYALGDYIDAEEVDKWTLYTIAQYCDGLVPDGKGGFEPRFTFNGILETREQAGQVLQVLASVFRGMFYWGASGSTGVVTVVADMPEDAIKLFTNANALNGMFTYSGTDASSRHAAAYVTWNDPNTQCKPAIEVVESMAIADMRAYRTVDIVAVGCISRGQAVRLGNWILDTELTADQLVSFRVGLADADIRPGQICKIQDKDFALAQYGGRILSGTAAGVQLDRQVTFELGKTYALDIVMPDGSLEQRDLITVPGATDTLTFSSSLPGDPDPLTVWAITASDLEPRQFRVLHVKEISPVQFEVIAIYHDPTKFARIEQNMTLDTPNFTRIQTGQVAAPTELTFNEFTMAAGPLLRSAVTVSWKASPDPRVVRYELEAKSAGTGQNYELVASTPGVSHTIYGTTDGTWSFRVKAFDALGTPSQYLELTDQTLVINGAAPDDVTGFQITNLTNTSVLTWDPVTSRNISHYEIRYSTSLLFATWNASITVIDRVAPGTTHATVASRTGTFLIKAVSVATEAYPQGAYSNNASSVSTDIDFLSTFNFVESLVEDDDFLGFRENVEVNGGNLELTEASPGVFEATGAYYHKQIIDLGDIYTTRVTPNVVAAGNLVTNDVDGWVDVDAIVNVDGVTDGQWALEVQVSSTQLDPVISADNLVNEPYDFTQAYWLKDNLNLTPDAATAVDGTMTAQRLTCTAVSGLHRVYAAEAKATTNLPYVFSLYAKAAGYSGLRVMLSGNSSVNSAVVEVDLLGVVAPSSYLTGTGLSDVSAEVTPVGEGWYKIDLLCVSNTDTNVLVQVRLNASVGSADSFTGDGTSGVYLWGATLIETDTVYNPWSEYLALDVGDINARAFRFRTLFWSYFATVTPSIEELSIIMDMPDYMQSGEDLTSSGVGLTSVTFPYEYRSERPSVVVTPQGMAQGDYYVLDKNNITATGFTVDFFNAGGTRIIRTFDYHAKGYGIRG